MKVRHLFAASLLACAPLTHVYADDLLGNQTADYLRKLGRYLGNFDLGTAVPDTVDPKELPMLGEITKDTYALPLTVLGSMPVVQIADITSSLYGVNKDTVFKNYQGTDSNSFAPFASDTKTTKGVTALNGIDQQVYQPLPTLQAIQNILFAPVEPVATKLKNINEATDITAALNTQRKSACDTDCEFFMGITSKAGGFTFDGLGGKLDGSTQIKDMFGSAVNKAVISSLSLNSLIGSSFYEETKPIDAAKSNFSNYDVGFYGKTPATQADAFIRYANGSLLPVTKSQDLQKAVTTLLTGSTKFSDRVKIVGALNKYNIMLRSYAALASVGTSNLYWMLAKRLPIVGSDGSSSKGPNGSPLTQASQEMYMATKRLLPQGDNGQPSKWMTQINQATPLEVQRQTAVLLAEMNYQLYLNRVAQERMLATMSTLQLQLLNTMKEQIKYTAPQ